MKYFKPRSLTWWAGFIPLSAGAIQIVGTDIETIMPALNLISAIYGGASPAALINIGIGAIGLRGAIGNGGVV